MDTAKGAEGPGLLYGGSDESPDCLQAMCNMPGEEIGAAEGPCGLSPSLRGKPLQSHMENHSQCFLGRRERCLGKGESGRRLTCSLCSPRSCLDSPGRQGYCQEEQEQEAQSKGHGAMPSASQQLLLPLLFCHHCPNVSTTAAAATAAATVVVRD